MRSGYSLGMSRNWPASRRAFLRSGGALAGGAMLLRYAPDVMAQAAQANVADTMRAQLGAAPIETLKLGERIVMLSGPGGNVVVSHGDVKIVVDGFVLPAWPRLKSALDALDGSPIRSLIDTHWHFDHADNNANFRKAGAGIIAHENTKTAADAVARSARHAFRSRADGRPADPDVRVGPDAERQRRADQPPAHRARAHRYRRPGLLPEGERPAHGRRVLQRRCIPSSTTAPADTSTA